MTTNVVLPPGVSLELYQSLPRNTVYFDGEGQAGNWSDPNNYWGGVAPAMTSLVVVPVNATMNGSFTVQTLMFLGAETVTVNGALTTLNTNTCESFMVCDEATAIFNPTSSLAAAGSLIVGNDDPGTLYATSSGSHYATLTSINGKIGRLAGGDGVVTLNGAHWTVSDGVCVGQAGTGTLSVTNGGVVTIGTDLSIGYDAGSTGQVSLSNGSTIVVNSTMNLGANPSGTTNQSVASVSIGAGCALSVGAGMDIFPGESLTLAGGTLEATTYSQPLRVSPGATLSGYGTITPSSAGLTDCGTIIATGGTLVVTGSIGGNGVIQIATGSTADLAGSTHGMVGVDFTGQGGTLDLAQGIAGGGSITDFAAGDHIVMPGVTSLAWNANTNNLTLYDQGHVEDKLHILGTYQSSSFTLASGVIGIVTSH